MQTLSRDTGCLPAVCRERAELAGAASRGAGPCPYRSGLLEGSTASPHARFARTPLRCTKPSRFCERGAGQTPAAGGRSRPESLGQSLGPTPRLGCGNLRRRATKRFGGGYGRDRAPAAPPAPTGTRYSPAAASRLRVPFTGGTRTGSLRAPQRRPGRKAAAARKARRAERRTGGRVLVKPGGEAG